MHGKKRSKNAKKLFYELMLGMYVIICLRIFSGLYIQQHKNKKRKRSISTFITDIEILLSEHSLITPFYLGKYLYSRKVP